MAEQFYTIVTNTGKAKIANSTVLGKKVNLVTLKVGDGGGNYYNPTEDQEDLINVKWTGAVGSVSIDESNPNWIVIETALPATVGGFTIREVGIFDDEQDLIAITKCAETYKPVVSEGTTKELLIRTILEVSNASNITLKIDPTVILATKKDINNLQVEIDDVREDLSNEIEEIKAEISNDIVITPSLKYGMNSVIKNSTNKSSIPKFKFYGKSIINLLGSDGNCESVSKFTSATSTPTLDSTNKVFGNNGIKITMTSVAGNISKILSNLDTTKYYLFSAYLKNGNATNVRILKEITGGGNALSSALITDATKFTRVGFLAQPSDVVLSNYLCVTVNGTSGQYAYVDGIQINEITASEYALGANVLLDKYPYVDGYACLTNPSIEIRHNNLIRNGNTEESTGYWIKDTSSTVSMSIVNNKFAITTSDTGGSHWYTQKVKVKPNTNYYISANLSDTTNSIINITDSNNAVSLTTALGVFNTGNYSEIGINMQTKNVAPVGIYYFDSIMLVEGDIAPASYKSCDIQRAVIEGQFADGDYVVYDNGEVTGQINWQHKTLFGKDYDWQFTDDQIGFKRIQITGGVSLFNAQLIASSTTGNLYGVKYDGKILSGGAVISSEEIHTGSISSGHLFLSVSDTDTGFIETINPNNDEVKVSMNGWKAVHNNGTRYDVWINVSSTSPNTDITAFPQGTATTLSVATTGSQTTLTVVDASIFKVGDAITLYGDNTSTISAINGNIITTNTATTTTTRAIGTVVARMDIPATDVRILTWCKNNIAPGYEGYKLHCKTQNPIPVNDINVHLDGENPIIDIGDNYINIDCGLVLGEVANPYTANGYYYVNSNANYQVYTPYLKNKVEKYSAIYKNNIDNTSLWTFGTGTTNTYLLNNGATAYTLVANYDTNATYTIDYQILRTIAPQIGSFECSFANDIVSILNKLVEDVGNKQTQDDTLDAVVDLSLYEVLSGIQINTHAIPINWGVGTEYWLGTHINFNSKKVMPVITIKKLSIIAVDSSGNQTEISNDCAFTGYAYGSKNGMFLRFSYIGSNSTIKNNIISYGARLTMDIILDCRGRV